MKPLILFVAVHAIHAQSLYNELASTIFLNSGTVRSTDNYGYLMIPCGYLEAENVTCATCSWGISGVCPYLYMLPPNGACSSSAPQPGVDRPGLDYKTVMLPNDSVSACIDTCCGDPACQAWVYVPSAPFNFMSCVAGSHCCYLKAAPPTPENSSFPGISSGTVSRSGPVGTSPPLGMRSAVPLGGLGAGAFELRADGTVHEMTIVNQSPAGSAKFGVVADMMLSVRQEALGSAPVTRAIRTQPPAYAQGVSEITYSGSYPVSKLALSDPALPLSTSLYAYSTLKPGDPDASAFPAVVFSLAIENPSDSPVNASIMLTLPFAAMNDCSRNSSNRVGNVSATSPGECVAACASDTRCASWTWTESTGICDLASDVPPSVYNPQCYCGVAGSWSSDGSSLMLTQQPSNATGSPAYGDISLRPVLLADGVSNLKPTFAVASEAAAVSAALSTSSSLPVGNGIMASGVFTDVAAPVGAVVVTGTIPPGGDATLSLVFAWYFPNRDHVGQNIGNYYSTIFEDSVDVANQLASGSKLLDVVQDINAHISMFASSSLPTWLADAAINEQSHYRGMIWTADGRMREFEANDCPDGESNFIGMYLAPDRHPASRAPLAVDSIHNDYQRHLPYLWTFPQFEVGKMRKWGSGQASDGHIWEYLGSFSLGPLDQPGGRIMADTTTLWIVELMELYKTTGDRALLEQLYPIAVRAIQWQIGACAGLALPQYLVCTYDILDLQQYPTTTFNSMVHLAAMQAGAYLAEQMQDNTTLQQAQNAYNAAVVAVQQQLWNSTYDYFRAYTGGDAIMADCLYGQMVGLHHGLGWFLNTTMIAQHLAAEQKYNQNPYGFTVLTGRHEPPPQRLERVAQMPAEERTPRIAQAGETLLKHHHALGIDTQDDVDWLGAGPTWSYIQLALGQLSIDEALGPAMQSTENFRSRLNDLWNIVGITTSGDWGTDASNGMPYITSHYGFLLPNYYLITGFSGQQVDIPAGSLTFSPRYPCPYSLPVLLAGTTGTLTCAAGNEYTLTIAFGSLLLPAGGLSVSGSAYNSPLALVAGQSVSWTAST